MAKFLYICNSDGALYKFRYPLIKALVDAGHDVHTITSSTSPEGSFVEQIEELGVSTHTADFDSRNSGIIHVAKLIFILSKVINKINPDYIHCFTHKANLLGGLASFISFNKSKLFFSITGAGIIYTQDDLKYRSVRYIFNILYKLLSRKVDVVFFQNPDDELLFIENKVFDKHLCQVTNGSGFDPSSIDLSLSYSLSSTFDIENTTKITVLYPSRALFEKGVHEFYSAAKVICTLSNKFEFFHVGSPSDSEQDGYTLEMLKSSDCVNYIEHRKSIYDLIKSADIVTLPSYREGTPRSVIEALYFDKFVITTDAPGCRETVFDNWNGVLIQPRSTNSLVSALLSHENTNFEQYKGRSKSIFDAKYNSKHIVKQTFINYFGE